MPPVLYIVIPCYNEEAVLPLTAPFFLVKLQALIGQGRIAEQSRVFFVNDGSRDGTWNIIQGLAAGDKHYAGISLSRNRGHQNALLAGLMTAMDHADITISIDADGQDDIGAMDEMMTEFEGGCDIVYGIRSNRECDSWFKRNTAEGYYRLINLLGARVVFNHADYRLLSKRALEGLALFKEANLFLRGLIPLVGFRSSSVYYVRHERVAGRSHYPLGKMFSLALDGVTSLTNRPLRMITILGLIFAVVSFIAIIAIFIMHFFGVTVWGWSSTLVAIFFMGGIQLLSIGVIGEYVGKIYTETKARPRYIISERTEENNTPPEEPRETHDN